MRPGSAEPGVWNQKKGAKTVYHDEMIVRKVPKWIRERTKENMDVFGMGLYDAFQEAVRNYPKLKRGSELWKAWYYDDFRLFIPSAINPERMDFYKYPLRYNSHA